MRPRVLRRRLLLAALGALLAGGLLGVTAGEAHAAAAVRVVSYSWVLPACAVFYAELALTLVVSGVLGSGLIIGALWVVDAVMERIR